MSIIKGETLYCWTRMFVAFRITYIAVNSRKYLKLYRYMVICMTYKVINGRSKPCDCVMVGVGLYIIGPSISAKWCFDPFNDNTVGLSRRVAVVLNHHQVTPLYHCNPALLFICHYYRRDANQLVADSVHGAKACPVFHSSDAMHCMHDDTHCCS